MSASDFITLACPSCGGTLAITSDVDRFECGHCGNQHLVKRDGDVLTIAPLVKEVQSVRAGVDKTAAELAIPRIRTEIKELQAQLLTLKSTSPGQLASANFREVIMPFPAVGLGIILVWLYVRSRDWLPYYGVVDRMLHIWMPLAVVAVVLVSLSIYWVVLYSRRMDAAHIRYANIQESFGSQLQAKQIQLQQNVSIANS